jgi:hypothetical protein
MSKFGQVLKTHKLALAGLAALVIGVPVAAQSGELAMLAALNKGAWNLRVRDDGTQQRLCVRDGQEFIQLRHKQAGCSRFIVQDNADEVVVQYTCRGNGYGRTSIRREGADVVQIQSQGIYEGAPFSISAEARHNGSC